MSFQQEKLGKGIALNLMMNLAWFRDILFEIDVC